MASGKKRTPDWRARNADAAEADDLAVRLHADANKLAKTEDPIARAKLLLKVRRAARAYHGQDVTSDVKERRRALVGALEAANKARTDSGRSQVLGVARAALAIALRRGEAEHVSDDALWAAIEAWKSGPRAKTTTVGWARVNELAIEFGCGAPDHESLRTAMSRKL